MRRVVVVVAVLVTASVGRRQRRIVNRAAVGTRIERSGQSVQTGQRPFGIGDAPFPVGGMRWIALQDDGTDIFFVIRVVAGSFFALNRWFLSV